MQLSEIKKGDASPTTLSLERGLFQEEKIRNNIDYFFSHWRKSLTLKGL